MDALSKHRDVGWPLTPHTETLTSPTRPSHSQVAGTSGRIQQDLQNEEDEGISVEAHGRAIAEALPNGRLTVIPGAGHMAPYEDPEAFNAGNEWFAPNSSVPLFVALTDVMAPDHAAPA